MVKIQASLALKICLDYRYGQNPSKFGPQNLLGLSLWSKSKQVWPSKFAWIIAMVKIQASLALKICLDYCYGQNQSKFSPQNLLVLSLWSKSKQVWPSKFAWIIAMVKIQASLALKICLDYRYGQNPSKFGPQNLLGLSLWSKSKQVWPSKFAWI